jgi:hypothetical protein
MVLHMIIISIIHRLSAHEKPRITICLPRHPLPGEQYTHTEQLYTFKLLTVFVALSNMKSSVQATIATSTHSSHSSYLVMHPD